MSNTTSNKKKSLLSKIADALFPETNLEGGVTGEDREFDFAEAIKDLNWNQVVDEIRTQVENESEDVKKFFDMVKSFEDIVPEEDKRYRAAFKALFSTTGITRDELLMGMQRQHSELKRQKELFNKTVVSWRSKMKNMSTDTKSLRNEINILKERIRELEKKEKDLLSKSSEQEREIKEAEVRFGTLTREIEQNVNNLSGKISSFIPKDMALPKAPEKPPEKEPEAPSLPEPSEEDKVSRELLEISGAYPAITPEASENEEPQEDQAPEPQTKECPRCGRNMELMDDGIHWKCKLCGHETSF